MNSRLEAKSAQKTNHVTSRSQARDPLELFALDQRGLGSERDSGVPEVVFKCCPQFAQNSFNIEGTSRGNSLRTEILYPSLGLV
jgi:hypothetical protein